jgi:protein MpaA
VKSFNLGYSSQTIPIIAHRFGSQGSNVLVLGGVHGDETEGVVAALGLFRDWLHDYPFKNLRVTLVPTFNIDGVLAKTRANANGVDLNRNLPTQDWSAEIANVRYHPGPAANSESENQALVHFIATEKPRFILSLHSWKPMLNINGDCAAEAKAIAAINGYIISPTIGYSTPGCLGTYSGLERAIPTITYEIERGLKAERVLKEHLPAIHAGLKVLEEKCRLN